MTVFYLKKKMYLHVWWCLIMLELHQNIWSNNKSKSKLQTWPGDSTKQKEKKNFTGVHLSNSASYWSSGSLIKHQGIFLQALQFIIKQHFIKPVIIILSAMGQPVLLWHKRFTLLTGKIAFLELLIVSFDVVKILGF